MSESTKRKTRKTAQTKRMTLEQSFNATISLPKWKAIFRAQLAASIIGGQMARGQVNVTQALAVADSLIFASDL